MVGVRPAYVEEELGRCQRLNGSVDNVGWNRPLMVRAFAHIRVCPTELGPAKILRARAEVAVDLSSWDPNWADRTMDHMVVGDTARLLLDMMHRVVRNQMAVQMEPEAAS